MPRESRETMDSGRMAAMDGFRDYLEEAGTSYSMPAQGDRFANLNLYSLIDDVRRDQRVLSREVADHWNASIGMTLGRPVNGVRAVYIDGEKAQDHREAEKVSKIFRGLLDWDKVRGNEKFPSTVSAPKLRAAILRLPGSQPLTRKQDRAFRALGFRTELKGEVTYLSEVRGVEIPRSLHRAAERELSELIGKNYLLQYAATRDGGVASASAIYDNHHGRPLGHGSGSVSQMPETASVHHGRQHRDSGVANEGRNVRHDGGSRSQIQSGAYVASVAGSAAITSIYETAPSGRGNREHGTLEAALALAGLRTGGQVNGVHVSDISVLSESAAQGARRGRGASR